MFVYRTVAFVCALRGRRVAGIIRAGQTIIAGRCRGTSAICAGARRAGIDRGAIRVRVANERAYAADAGFTRGAPDWNAAAHTGGNVAVFRRAGVAIVNAIRIARASGCFRYAGIGRANLVRRAIGVDVAAFRNCCRRTGVVGRARINGAWIIVVAVGGRVAAIGDGGVGALTGRACVRRARIVVIAIHPVARIRERASRHKH